MQTPVRYEITYEYEGNEHSIVEIPTEGFEEQFTQKVLNRIESIVKAGAVITDLTGYNK